MSRQRFIHPTIWESEDFTALSHDARLLFIGLFSLADDEGRGKGSDRVLSGTIFPGEAPSMPTLKAEVAARGMARFYAVAGSSYYDLPAWSKYQHPQYPQPTRIPPLPDNAGARVASDVPAETGQCNSACEGDLSSLTEDSMNVHGTLDELSVLGRDGLGRDGLGRKKRTAPRAPRSESLVGFAEFWKGSPRRKSRGKAEDEWRKLAPDEVLRSKISAAQVAQAEERQRKIENGEWVPELKHPATWLHQRCWEDEAAQPRGALFSEPASGECKMRHLTDGHPIVRDDLCAECIEIRKTGGSNDQATDVQRTPAASEVAAKEA